MPQSLAKVYLHAIFSTKNREPLLADAWRDELGDNRIRGIALDVALIHIASMSNLAAALGWALVDLIEHPGHLGRVVAGDADLAQRCALESTRLAQRSIMSRAPTKVGSFGLANLSR